jgi:hypothetical protein
VFLSNYPWLIRIAYSYWRRQWAIAVQKRLILEEQHPERSIFRTVIVSIGLLQWFSHLMRILRIMENGEFFVPSVPENLGFLLEIFHV